MSSKDSLYPLDARRRCSSFASSKSTDSFKTITPQSHFQRPLQTTNRSRTAATPDSFLHPEYNNLAAPEIRVLDYSNLAHRDTIPVISLGKPAIPINQPLPSENNTSSSNSASCHSAQSTELCVPKDNAPILANTPISHRHPTLEIEPYSRSIVRVQEINPENASLSESLSTPNPSSAWEILQQKNRTRNMATLENHMKIIDNAVSLGTHALNSSPQMTETTAWEKIQQRQKEREAENVEAHLRKILETKETDGSATKTTSLSSGSEKTIVPESCSFVKAARAVRKLPFRFRIMNKVTKRRK